MEDHIRLLMLRIVLTLLVAASLPVAHMNWGESPEAAGIEGPTAFTLLIGMAIWSFLAAFCYFFIGSLLQVIFSQRLKVALRFDLVAGMVLVATLSILGVFAHYRTTETPPAVDKSESS